MHRKITNAYRLHEIMRHGVGAVRNLDEPRSLMIEKRIEGGKMFIQNRLMLGRMNRDFIGQGLETRGWSVFPYECGY